ncbi:hypothetical protein [Thaumasiovibrio sp. DFM-14]|uniref:hypothetical protein n=1 Tax=Thaumasiovibrio sp. DFM-14 TaxID=3384792 RepID=UPI0039A1C7B4
MFENLLEFGNVLVPVLLSYTAAVATYKTRIEAAPSGAILLPTALQSTPCSLITLLMAPCIFLPALYVWQYDGFKAALITFFALPLIMTITIRMLSPVSLIFYHFVAATGTMFIGYYLAYTTWP